MLIYDGISLKKFVPNNPIRTDALEYVATYANGNISYKLNGHNPLYIYITPYNTLRIKGSLPHYWQGHSYSYDVSELRHTIESIEDALGVSLYNSEVTKLEFNCIIEAPQEITMNSIKLTHHTPNRYVKNVFQHGMEFKRKSTNIKFYDYVARNKQTLEKNMREMLMNQFMYDPNNYNYFKLECVWNRINNIKLNDLFTESKISYFKDTLKSFYKEMPKTPITTFKGSKKPNMAEILLGYIIDQPGVNESDLKSIIKDNSMLNIHDIRYRLNELSKMKKKISSNEYLIDLSNDLSNSLNK